MGPACGLDAMRIQNRRDRSRGVRAESPCVTRYGETRYVGADKGANNYPLPDGLKRP